MKEAKFSASLNLVVAKAGKKVPTSVRPELIVLPTVNRFSINSLASEAMKLESGDKITLLVNTEAESFDEKFFITRGFGEDAATLAATGKAKGYGRVLTFNYSGIWGQMLQNDVEAGDAGPDYLVELGIVEKRQTPQGKTSYTALRKVIFEIQSMGEQDLGGDELQEVFALTNSKLVDYTPRTVGEGEEQGLEEEPEMEDND